MDLQLGGDVVSDPLCGEPARGTWLVRHQFNALYGTTSGDVPIPADDDGDGRTELAIRRPSTGQWFVRNVAGFPVIYGIQASDVPSSCPTPSGACNFPSLRTSTRRRRLRRHSGKARAAAWT